MFGGQLTKKTFNLNVTIYDSGKTRLFRVEMKKFEIFFNLLIL